MKKRYFLLLSLLLALTVQAQRADLTPLPQQITWGETAFSKNDAPHIPILQGVVGDKAVAKYRKLVPTQAEGYYLKVTPTQIIMVGRDDSGLFYAQQTLAQLESMPQVMQCEITDYPSVACRGVIEGFYGNPWSQQDRLRQFDFYGKHKMNTYVFGPKDDPYHRARWREPYPEKEGQQLHELVEAAHRNHVQFVWAIHPGGDIKWNQTDSLNVIRKFESMYSLGVRSFALFFDDIEGEGAKADKQAGLLNYITDQFVHRHKDVQPLIICPTIYNKEWTGNNDYLKIMGTKLYPEVRIMWTGNTVVDMIQREDMEFINNEIGRKAFIWLNYPVNDYCRTRLLMGRTYGNGKDINDMVSGFCSNPMEYAEASKLSLFSIAEYTWNMPAYDEMDSWKRAIKELMPTCTDDFRFFCINNIDAGINVLKLRRDGESEGFSELKAHEYLLHMSMAAQHLLADSINHPEMLKEIAPWVRSMDLLGQRGTLALNMQQDLLHNDSVAFIGHYRAHQEVLKAQQAITSRDYEGSIVKAKPEVSGDNITPWVNNKIQTLLQQYRTRFSYGKEFLPKEEEK